MLQACMFLRSDMFRTCVACLWQVEFLYPPLTRIKLQNVVVISAKALVEANRSPAAAIAPRDEEPHRDTNSLFDTAKKLANMARLEDFEGIGTLPYQVLCARARAHV
jgi:hypothetical protein